jgi:hypothetical protein
LRARTLLALGRAAQARAPLADAAAALAQSRHADAELQVQVPLMQAMAERALGDTVLAQSFAHAGSERLAVLRNPPQRLVRLAESVRAEVGATSH